MIRVLLLLAWTTTAMASTGTATATATSTAPPTALPPLPELPRRFEAGEGDCYQYDWRPGHSIPLDLVDGTEAVCRGLLVPPSYVFNYEALDSAYQELRPYSAELRSYALRLELERDYLRQLLESGADNDGDGEQQRRLPQLGFSVGIVVGLAAGVGGIVLYERAVNGWASP